MSDDLSEQAKEKLQQLQMTEQSLQKTLAQKQQFQAQLAEVSSAIEELAGKQKAHRIIGNIMVETDAAALRDELVKKQELLDVRIKTIGKQEERIREKAKALQDEVMARMQHESASGTGAKAGTNH